MPDDPESEYYELEATTAAASTYAVEPRIRRDDFIMRHHLDMYPYLTTEQAADIYFSSGSKSTFVLDELIRRFGLDRDGISLLEFASGHGCLTRHLKLLAPRYVVTACDIHPAAVTFMRDVIGADAVVSDPVPERLDIQRQFDVVFVLSLFSHLPNATFRRWLETLLDRVVVDGLLIFTAHGRVGQANSKLPPFGPDGSLYLRMSEQHDISLDDYGTMLVRPHFVFEALADRTDCTLLLYQEAFWWGVQDVYVYRKLSPGAVLNRAIQGGPSPEPPREPETEQALRRELEQLRASRSWRVTRPLRAAGDLLRRLR